MNETELLKRITINPKIFGGKSIIRGHRLASGACFGHAGCQRYPRNDSSRLPLAGVGGYSSLFGLCAPVDWTRTS